MEITKEELSKMMSKLAEHRWKKAGKKGIAKHIEKMNKARLDKKIKKSA